MQWAVITRRLHVDLDLTLAVGCINKKLAALNMGMARCKKRYHRQLYIGWELPAITNNVHVLFQCLWPEMAALAV